MKRWFKRSLFGFAAAALAVGTVAGCSSHRHGNWSEADATAFRTKMVEKAAGKLDLDAAQKAKLDAFAQKLQAQRVALRNAGGSGEPRAQFQALFAGHKLDRAAAAKLIDEKTGVVKAGSGEVIAAAGDFFDSLNPAQQQKVRDFMDRGGRRFGRG